MCSIQDQINKLGLGVENIDATLKAISNEIDLDLYAEEDTNDSNNLSVEEDEQMEEAYEPVSPLLIRGAQSDRSDNTAGDEQPLNECFFQTQRGNFKSYTISINGDNIVFGRPQSTKQQELIYSMTSFQCVKSLTTKEDKASNSIFSSLLFVLSSDSQRRVYFDSEEACNHWHKEILAAQGYLDKRLEAYEVVKEIDSGSYGSVILAQHKLSGLQVAIKMIAMRKIDQTFKSNKQAFSELEIIQELTADNCSNVLQVIESFTTDSAYVIVTQYMQGNLFNYVCAQPSQPLDEDLAKSIIRQVAKGLQGMHSKNIIHKDIKIENILMTDLSRKAQARIADFGCSEKLESADSTASFRIGTPGYMAPEVLAGKQYTCAVDIYSLGALMHVLLTASLPFWS